jgi:hypothetical protein
VVLGLIKGPALCRSIATYAHVRGKKLLAIFLGERNGIRDFGAVGLLAEMAVSNSLQTDGITV